MTRLLPEFNSEADYDGFEHTEARYLPAMEVISRRHDLPTDDLSKFDEGESAIVFAAGDAFVIKLYPPLWAERIELETAVLNHMHGRLPVPTPQVLYMGALEGWRYFVMTRLTGRRLIDVMPSLSEPDQIDIHRKMGEAVRALHNLPELQTELPIPDWRSFLDQQVAACAEHQRQGHVNESLLCQMPGFLDAYLPETPTDTAILHTELGHDVWFVEERSGTWALTGLFDFGDALLGDPRADIFWRLFEPSHLRSYLTGYGYAPNELTEDLAYTMFAFLLLHRYATLTWLFKGREHILETAETLESVAVHCFPLR